MIRKQRLNKRKSLHESAIKRIKTKRHMLEGISKELWNQIQTDEQGHWFWNGKKIHKDDFWDYAWEEFQYYCEENGLNPDEEDFDAWAETEDLDGMLEDVFANGEDYEDIEYAEPDDIASDLRYWMEDNIEREEFDLFKDFKNHIDLEELDDILKKAKANSIHVKPASTDEFLSEMKESIEEGGGLRCYKVNTFDMVREYTVYCDIEGINDETYSGTAGFQVHYHKG